jgi:small subunit ribosomal protein S8
MVMSDPVADMLTRIRNAQQAGLNRVTCAVSKHKEQILNLMQREGYIRGFKHREIRPGIAEFDVDLKYYDGAPVISFIKKISKPGRRMYSDVNALPRVYNGLGIAIISTPKGLMTDAEARQANVGGEVICQIF